MRPEKNRAYITTDRERCRMCYTCVRECPAKAIRIVDGQAEVLGERCIACGNCVKVCSQNAKKTRSTRAAAQALLTHKGRVAALVAPSFPAEFTEMTPDRFVGVLRKLGFDLVCEVAFGADMVAKAYKNLLKQNPDKRYIATTCPAIVGYVERYHPSLVPMLAPIVSPMLAAARALKKIHGEDLKIVFIGPCIAKKVEAGSQMLDGEVDVAITFRELRKLISKNRIKPEKVEPAEFSPPHPGAGALFAISRGILQAAGLEEDLIAGEIVTADGHKNFTEALREFSNGELDIRLLELLCCQGCIMGPGMETKAPLFSRRNAISKYVREYVKPEKELRISEELQNVPMARQFSVQDQRIALPAEDEIKEILNRLGKVTPEDELNCGACGYDTCREHAVAIFKGLAENEMCLPYTIDLLKDTVEKLSQSSDDLAATQEALMHSEKLASMGQLAAGVAHEVNNPLGVVLMYAHLLLGDTKEEDPKHEDLKMIAEQADRCKKIVAGLLNFARQNKVLRQPTDMHEVFERALQSVPRPQNVVTILQQEMANPIADADGDQLQQVFSNLVSNAYAAMPEGGTLTLRAYDEEERVFMTVKDTGTGIPEEARPKIFEPFYTTKQIGKGTGLGLSVTYGIIKMHRGNIRFETNSDAGAGQTGTTFIVELPRRGEEQT